MQIFLNSAGGLALFLLAMLMMTEGLKAFAGGALKRLLERWTSTPLRGLFTGILVTGVVQSSSAVTVATIGFVNAGILTLRQALGVIFGTNIGTTVTGWLVGIVGFDFKIESFALPIIAVGVVLRLLAPRKRLQGLGEALAGFGLFFLGLAILKDAFGGMAATYGTSFGGANGGYWPVFLLVGFVATLLTQSSSAAIALILTAAAGGVLGMEAAAAAVIGANIGTTSTAALAVLKATPGAKRLALGHILFNLVTGIVALALLPSLLWLVRWMAHQFGADDQPVLFLALFHTVFNVLGAVIMLPFARRLANLLEKFFRKAEEDMGRPQHLDQTLTSTPELAVSALRAELIRLRCLVNGIVRAAISRDAAKPAAVEVQSAALRTLGAAIISFVSRVHTESMPLDVADKLAQALRISRYLDEAARLTPSVLALRAGVHRLANARLQTALEQTLADAEACVSLADCGEETSGGDAGRTAVLDQFETTYQHTKAALLAAVAAGGFSVEATVALLDHLSATRRMVEQLVKADRLLDGSKPSTGMEEANTPPQPPQPEAEP